MRLLYAVARPLKGLGTEYYSEQEIL
jgi:hypothetical protein